MPAAAHMPKLKKLRSVRGDSVSIPTGVTGTRVSEPWSVSAMLNLLDDEMRSWVKTWSHERGDTAKDSLLLLCQTFSPKVALISMAYFINSLAPTTWYSVSSFGFGCVCAKETQLNFSHSNKDKG